MDNSDSECGEPELDSKFNDGFDNPKLDLQTLGYLIRGQSTFRQLSDGFDLLIAQWLCFRGVVNRHFDFVAL